ncbi:MULTISPECIES: UDP-N-acetylmuramoyl-L-alanyl-D-glutamate--2,6-diaminopimelate ligase [unclassified Agarivorans]|uniref:UDP-N-acetylmuramoyl-L-alanyl-D-glutamate--2, 6-diaminopimelate ligase n=1 Tax=unclassified Agarivorans TaxID=2636026 RepID=UPI0026E3A73A|nr:MULTISPECIES: UDP-N-acetylmuramoyl-L-alanyl-D-glutamate--2,6-diaminopimelate ligase [unclassified Agarivorans]MDO6686905.1 UDP-N-acetylmuramoyl-L-alanyl-D-glutamate--2,6-diaminopimelate ligase [Agarivorans sp. 3_MG-2023]MDO6716702.1 UDP-N-acetylmuramoyl-L-alanyl-D-glutamate--2,6-diaminopimelate ligase [Agarivorans sp. 2_MG-2023]
MATPDLSALLARFAITVAPDISFKHLSLNSREITSGDIFVAVKGHQVDGRNYIEAAIYAGAVAVIIDADDEKDHGHISWLNKVPCIQFWRLNRQLSQLASSAYFPDGNPLTLVGVTGTNGKSTVTHLIANLANLNGVPAAVTGTLGNGKPGQLIASENTTADAITIQRQLAEMHQQGFKLVAMEISSHGLVQQRVASVPFKVAIFTNLSRDHLDYHGSMAEYGRAKQALFDWPSLECRLINADDGFGKQLLQHYPSAQALSLEDSRAAWQIGDLQFSELGASGYLLSPDASHEKVHFQSPLLGRFNADNLLAAIACLQHIGLELADIIGSLPTLNAVPGRMELFTGKCSVVVDYAHTPDALDKALSALRQHCHGKLICIFGCGGDRDKGKRPLMAAIAEQKADQVIVTDDNPRFEDANAIVEDILLGFQHTEQVTVIHERSAAIAQAIEQSGAKDIILVAGKGHESYQVIGAEVRDYDERALVEQLVGASG